MAIEVEAPNGDVIEFPENTAHETITRVMRERYGGPLSDKERVARGGRTVAQQRAKVDADAAEYESKVAALNRQEQFGRAAALGGRAILKGVAAIPDLIVDPLTRLVNRAGEKPQDVASLTAGEGDRYFPKQMTLSEGVDYLADKIGAPRPQTSSERIYGDVMGGIASAAVPVGVGRQLAQSAAPVVQGVGRTLAAQPGLQLATGATAGGASSITRESGGGVGAQAGAALLGGLTPAGITAGAPAAFRGVMRGRSGQQMLDNMAAFEGVGATPTVGQASEMPWVRGMESVLSKTPGSAGYLARTGARQGQEIGEGVEDIASTLVPKSSAENAGRAITQGIRGPGGFLDRTKQISDRLYEDLDAAIPADARVGVESTRKALGEINAPIPGAPATSRQFQNSRISGIREGLESDLKSGGTATRPEVAKALQLSRKQLVDDASAAAMRNTQRQQLGLSNMEKVPTAAEIDAKVAEDLQGLADGRLPYEALRRLRSVVGREVEDSTLMSDVPRSKWKQLYGALSQDLEAAAGSSPAAQRAWGRANMYYRARMNRLDAIDHVIDKNGGPEAVFNAALSGTRDGATTLRAVLKSLPKEGQRELTAAFVRRLGKAANSAQNDAGDAFSTQTFLTNWNKVSPEARAALFDRHGMQFSRDMDKIARVASNLRDGSEIYKNPAGTASALQQTSALTAFVLSALTGNLGIAGGIAAAAVGTNGMARILANPKFVKWLAQSTERPVGAIPAQIVTLREIAESEDLPELERLADSAEQLH